MWALRHRSHDTAWLLDFLGGLERLAESMVIRRTYATPRSNRYAQLLNELAAGLGTKSPAFHLSSEEKQETRKRLGGELYLVTAVRRFVLLRLTRCSRTILVLGAASRQWRSVSSCHPPR